MSVLFIGSRKKYLPMVNYCKKNKLDYFLFEAEPGLPNASDELSTETHFIGYDNFFNINFYQNFCKLNGISPSWIINFRDEKKWVNLEWSLQSYFKTKNKFCKLSRSFFYSKKKQDDLCKELLIPTIESNGEKIIVKKDCGDSGGTNFYVCKKSSYQKKENEFIQKYINIQYTLGVHIHISDDTKWSILNYHKVFFKDNCPDKSVCPVSLRDNEREVVEDSVLRLSKKLSVNNRIVFWQFVASNDDELYSMDFNCRPSGGFDAGSFDSDISNLSWATLLFENKNIDTIRYTSQVSCLYQEPVKFGYSSYKRLKNPIKPFNFKVFKT